MVSGGKSRLAHSLAPPYLLGLKEKKDEGDASLFRQKVEFKKKKGSACEKKKGETL